MAAGTIAPPDLDDTATPTMPPIQGAPAPLAQASPSQPASPGAGATPVAQQGPPAPLPGTAPAANGITNQPQKGQINTGPTAEFDPKKLAKVKTTLDLLNAMKPTSRTDYMDWWEWKQHGDINDKYDALQKSIGQRPIGR